MKHEFVLIFLTCYLWAFAQIGNGQTTTPQGPSAIIDSNIQVTAVAGTGSSGSSNGTPVRKGTYQQMITAEPGPTTQGPYSGWVGQDSPPFLYPMDAYHTVPVEQLRNMALPDEVRSIQKEIKDKKIRAWLRYPDETHANAPLVFLDYNPRENPQRDAKGNVTQHIMWSHIHVCGFNEDDANCWASLSLVGKGMTNSTKAALIAQYRAGIVTTTQNKGLGANLSALAPTGVSSAGVSIGWSKGATMVGNHIVKSFEIIFVDDGLSDEQLAQIEAQKKKAAQSSETLPTQPQSPAPAPQPAAPPTTIERTYTLDEVERLLKVFQHSNTPAPVATPTPTPAPQASSTGMGIPQLEVWFEFEKSNIDRELQLKHGEYDKKLNDFVAWAKSHPEYTLVVEGHTCRMGSKDLNWKLAGHRADALRQLLIDKGVPSTQLKPASYGKPPTGSEINPEDRRAFVHIEGDASGK